MFRGLVGLFKTAGMMVLGSQTSPQE
jgi:hypothetical protein